MQVAFEEQGNSTRWSRTSDVDAHKDAVQHVCRWQSQERAQLLEGRKLRERQHELEDALIDLKVSFPVVLSLYMMFA